MSDSYPPIDCRATPAGAPPAAAGVTPAHLLVALPHLFGANPAGLLVILGLIRGRLGGAAVSSLRDLTGPGEVDHAVNVSTEYDDDSAVVAVVGDPASPDRAALPTGPDGTSAEEHLADLVRESLSRYRVDVVQALRVPALAEAAPWVDLDSGATGTMPAVGSDRSTLIRRVLAGELALPDATALHAALGTPGDDPAAAARFRRQLARTAPVRGLADQQVATAVLDSVIGPAVGGTAAGAAATASRPAPLDVLDDERAAQLVVALHHDAVQEHALLLTGRHTPAARRLWRQLVRRTVGAPDHRALPAALLATAAYLDGDARVARVALDIAAANPGPDDRLRTTIAHSLEGGIPPRRIRRLLADHGHGHRNGPV